MEILNLLILEDKKDYKCFSELKRLLKENEEFKQVIVSGVEQGKIKGFDLELWNKIRRQNIRIINNFDDVFFNGSNIGYCTVASKQLSYSLDECYLCGGILPVLSGTANCEDGSHTWILYNNEIIDTTLMLIIDEDYADKLGYVEENRYDPNVDPIYIAAKQFTNDSTLCDEKKLD